MQSLGSLQIARSRSLELDKIGRSSFQLNVFHACSFPTANQRDTDEILGQYENG
jgi:hypothetical protein